MPFLSVITRCYKRPEMLERNIASLEAQTEPDFEQLFIVDDVGRGIGWANRQLAHAKPAGEYVMVLDDDDMLTDVRAIELLKVATLSEPELVIFRADHGPLGILPDKLVWERRPILGHIGSCDFITRLDVWNQHIFRFGVDEGGDYAFLHAAWFDQPEVFWLDEVLAGVQRISRGQPEAIPV